MGEAESQKRVYEIDGRDRGTLWLALGLGILCADLLFALIRGTTGLGLTALVFAWVGAVLWQVGGWRVLAGNRSGLVLTGAVLALGVWFALASSRWLWLLNLAALPGLMVMQTYELRRENQYPWHRAFMLCERGVLLLEGLFGRLGAALQALTGKREKTGRGWYVAGGLAVALPLLALVLPLLVQADALFGLAAEEAMEFFTLHFGDLAGRLLLGTIFGPLLFGVLYGLRRPERSGLGAAREPWEGRADPAFAVTVLAVLDGLYLLFVGVQARTLFGGPAYVAAAGLSFAEYARSGFFQLVWVSAINLLVVLGLAQLTRREGRLWRWGQGLSALMVALSALLLGSAAWRMSLYVGIYGLSVKRFLTYWGMGVLGVLLGAAAVKLWRGNFVFFRVLAVAGLAAWLGLNAVNVDALVARYNVEGYLSGRLEAVDVHYLTNLSYDVLPVLEKLEGGMEVDMGEGTYVLRNRIAKRRMDAWEETTRWQTWNLSAYWAAVG